MHDRESAPSARKKLQATTAAPAPMTIKAAAADEDDEKNDEKDFHVWLQCDGTTLAR